MSYKEESKSNIKVLESVLHLTNKLSSKFKKDNFISKGTLENKVSKVQSRYFNKTLNSYKPLLNELLFITAGMNHKFARVIVDAIQKLHEKGEKILSSGGSNELLISLITEETNRIYGAVKRIQRDPSGYKLFVKKNEHNFDESSLLKVVSRIQVEQAINIFIDELNGGDMALSLRDTLRKENDIEINLYGVDRNIEKGLESKKKAIRSARGGLLQVSRSWVDIGFCTNRFLPFYEKESVHDNEVISFYKMNVIRPGGLFIFNYPFYRLNEIRHILETNQLISVLNTKDKLGNLLFVLKLATGEEKSSLKWIEEIEYNPGSLPTTLERTIIYANEGIVSVEKFRAKHIDMHDMLAELEEEDSAQFLIDYYSQPSHTQQLQNPLMEYKPGHIPAIATSEVLNGRYVDEVLNIKIGKSFQFDHLFSTKIVKRELEETEEQIGKDGEPITIVRCKKNNYIISTALTAQGEYIELFSTEKVSDEDLD